jgi:hypothetical protein
LSLFAPDAKTPPTRAEVRLISPSKQRRARGQRFVKEPTRPTKVIPSVLSMMTVGPLPTLTAPDLIHCLMSLLTFPLAPRGLVAAHDSKPVDQRVEVP